MAKDVEMQALRVGRAHAAGPAAVISRRAAERLRAGSVWVYRTEVEEVWPGLEGSRPAVEVAAGLAPGSVVTVLDGRGIPVGSALFSEASQITLRMVSERAGLGRAGYLEEVAARVAEAVALRERLAPRTEEDDACRLIFSEADRLPGMVADRYNDLVVVQMLTQGTAQADVREVVARVLRERVAGVATVVERGDARMQRVEALGAVPEEPLYADRAEAKLQTVFAMNGLRFRYNAGAGQKTGAFLDQRLNYRAAAAAGWGRALDVCTYQGGFALHLAERCEWVTGVDASRAALEVADANLELNRELNPGLGAKVDWIEADAFELLREFEAGGRRYDTVVLDPPAFAKTKRAAEGAARGYKEMNLRALKMLSAGGTLVTCSCSHHVGMEEFLGVVEAAARDARRRVQVVEARGAAPDHPAMLGLPETGYLKCLICRVE